MGSDSTREQRDDVKCIKMHNRKLPSALYLLMTSSPAPRSLRGTKSMTFDERLNNRNDVLQRSEPSGELGIDLLDRGAELGVEVFAVWTRVHRQLYHGLSVTFVLLSREQRREGEGREGEEEGRKEDDDD